LSRNIESELLVRSTSCGLPLTVLRAVYLREFASPLGFTPELALRRVDEFIVYALTRDTKCSQDRDLVPSARIS
jgi:hypothetical protein